MKNRVLQYFLIIAILSAIAGGYFYFQSTAAQKINSSQTPKLTDGLVGYWTFDGADISGTTAYDRNPTATKNNGVIANATPAIGKIGQALSFDGTNSYITAGTPNLGITDSITECAWIYPRAITNQHVLQYVSSTDADSFGIAISSVLGGRIGALDFSNWYQVVSTNPASLNTWQHVCATVNIIAGASNDIFKLYINGAFDNEAVVSYNPYIGNNGLMIGQAVDNSQRFNGYIDEPRIYNRVLSASEITELYQQGQTKINASQTGKLTDGLTGYWSFDGNNMDWSQSTAEVREVSSGNKCSSAPCHGNAIIMTTADAVPGKIGQALNFTASGSQYISTSASIRDLFSTDYYEGTVSVWVRPTGSPVDAVDVFSLPAVVSEVSNQGFGILRGTISGSPDKIWAYSDWAGPDSAGIVGATFAVGEWTHIIWLKSSAQLCIYKNGVQEACTTQTELVSSGSFLIGKGPYFTGDIDEVRTYNRALSASEITELYQQGQTKINASQTGKLTDGLVGYWTMDGANTNWTSSTAGTVTDSSGNSNTGTLNNMSQSTSPAIGKIGQGLNLDGTDDYVNVPDTSNSALDITNLITLSVWYKYGGKTTDWSRIVSKIVSSGSNPWDLYALLLNDGVEGNQKPSFYFSTGVSGTGTSITSTVPLQVGTWYHIVGAYDATTGARSITVNGTITSSVLASPITIGTNDDPFRMTFVSGAYIKGIIDEVRVYNKALSQSEVTELYNMGR